MKLSLSLQMLAGKARSKLNASIAARRAMSRPIAGHEVAERRAKV